jgi:hypothetical protein
MKTTTPQIYALSIGAICGFIFFVFPQWKTVSALVATGALIVAWLVEVIHEKLRHPSNIPTQHRVVVIDKMRISTGCVCISDRWNVLKHEKQIHMMPDEYTVSFDVRDESRGTFLLSLRMQANAGGTDNEATVKVPVDTGIIYIYDNFDRDERCALATDIAKCTDTLFDGADESLDIPARRLVDKSATTRGIVFVPGEGNDIYKFLMRCNAKECELSCVFLQRTKELTD